MPFEKLRHPQARERARTVLVSLERPPSAKLGQLRVRFGPEVCTAAGLALDQRVQMQWGYGEDAGSVLVLPGDDGPKLRTQAGKRDKDGPPPADALLETQFGGLPDEDDPRPGVGGAAWTLLPVARSATKCVWRLHEGGVVIGLPREWWAVTETAAAPVAPVAPVAETADPDAPRVGIPPSPPFATVPPPRPDPHDPNLQETALRLLSNGCSLPDLRKRLRLDETGFATLREALRQRTAQARAQKTAAEPSPVADTRAELERIRRLANPNGAAA